MNLKIRVAFFFVGVVFLVIVLSTHSDGSMLTIQKIQLVRIPLIVLTGLAPLASLWTLVSLANDYRNKKIYWQLCLDFLVMGIVFLCWLDLFQT